MKKVVTIIVIVVLAIIIVVGVLFLKQGKDQPASQAQTTQQEDQTVQPNLFEHDQDRDGILDEKEAELGTSDTEFDTDGDGLSDADEINIWKTDPTKEDSDGDGYTDGWEVIKGFDPLSGRKL